MNCLAPAASKLMAFVDDASLVDEVKALYATTQEKESLRKALSPLLKGMFADHTDPYSLLVSFLKRGGRVLCSATLALPRVALAEFMKWLEEQNGLKETVCVSVLGSTTQIIIDSWPIHIETEGCTGLSFSFISYLDA